MKAQHGGAEIHPEGRVVTARQGAGVKEPVTEAFS
jgi:hypothetical protein